MQVLQAPAGGTQDGKEEPSHQLLSVPPPRSGVQAPDRLLGGQEVLLGHVNWHRY